MYPEKFDTSTLSDNDRELLAQFFVRRELFDAFIKNEKLTLFTCPGCGYPTLNERGGYDICAVCNWEDDRQDNETADEIWGGPNADLSLTENRIQIGRVFQGLAEEKGSCLNENVIEVFGILKNHQSRMNQISKSIPMESGLEDEHWSKWRKAEKTLLEELIK